MLSLNTHLSLDVIRANKKLQEIECNSVYKVGEKLSGGSSELLLTKEENKKYSLCAANEAWLIIPAPTIADVIDNAEMLFGKGKHICNKCGVINGNWSDGFEFFDTYCDECRGFCTIEFFDSGYEIICKDILEMCQKDIKLENIEEYILKNIK